MRKKYIFTIIGVIIYFISFGQQGDKVKSSTQMMDLLIQQIEENNPSKIWVLSSNEFKSNNNLVTLSNTVAQISTLSKNHKRFTRPIQVHSHTTSYNESEGVWKEVAKNKYGVYPSFFGTHTNKLFMVRVGYEISIELVKMGEGWLLNQLTIIDNYANKALDMNKYIKDFISYGGNYNIKFTAISKKKQVYGFDKLKVEEFISAFTNNQLKYVRMEDFDYKNYSGTVFGLSLSKKIAKPNSSISDVNSLMDSFLDSQRPIFLEIVFFDDERKTALISDGKNYAFYELSNILSIKKIIVDEFEKIN